MLQAPTVYFQLCCRPIAAAAVLVCLLGPSCADSSKALRDAAREHQDRGGIERAIELYREAIGREPNRADLFAELAEAYCANGEAVEAAFASEKALSLDPSMNRATAVMARALLELGRFEEALPYALRASDTPSPDAYAVWTLADILLRLGKYEDAERNYQAVLHAKDYPQLSIDPDEPQKRLSETDLGYLYFGMGLACRGQGLNREAMAWYDSALVRIPSEPEVHFAQGALHERRWEYPEALECYRRATRVDPFFVEGQIRKGIMLLETGDLLAARDLLITIYYDYEPVDEVVFALGRIAAQKGFILEALGYFREARTINQAMAPAWLRESLMLRRLGLSSEAEICLQRAASQGSTAATQFLEPSNRLDAHK